MYKCDKCKKEVSPTEPRVKNWQIEYKEGEKPKTWCHKCVTDKIYGDG